MADAAAARRTRLGWVLLAVVVLGTLGWALWPRSGPESVTAHTRRLAREFRCVDCEGLSVAESATASARAARADIRRRIEAGESDADIRGVFVARYGESVLLKPEGRGIGLGHKLRAYSLQDQGRDTVEANVELGLPIDSREYGIGSQILVDLGITTMRVMTNNPSKYGGLEGYGLEIVERVPLEVTPNAENIDYLRTKAAKMGHLLDLEPQEEGD